MISETRARRPEYVPGREIPRFGQTITVNYDAREVTVFNGQSIYTVTTTRSGMFLLDQLARRPGQDLEKSTVKKLVREAKADSSGVKLNVSNVPQAMLNLRNNLNSNGDNVLEIESYKSNSGRSTYQLRVDNTVIIKDGKPEGFEEPRGSNLPILREDLGDVYAFVDENVRVVLYDPSPVKDTPIIRRIIENVRGHEPKIVYEAQLPGEASETKQPREALSDEELGDHLAGFGNHEAKALLLIEMARTGDVYILTELNNLFGRLQKGFDGWILARKTAFSYCTTLEDVDLVVKAKDTVVRNRKTSFGYQVTEEGRRSVALAGHLLAFSEAHPEYSLQELFPQTSSPQGKETVIETRDGAERKHKNRAPLTVLQLYRDLLTRDGSIRVSDLEIYTKGSAVGKHIRTLQEKGVLEHESTKPYKPIITFAMKEDAPEEPPATFKTNVTFTREIYDLARTHTGDITIDSILKRYQDQHPDKAHASSLRHRVSSLLRYLQREGYLEKTGYYDWKKQSRLVLNDTQRPVIQELVTIINDFQTGDEAFIAAGQAKAYQIIRNPERVASLMKKAKEKSPSKNSTPKPELIALILGIIASQPPGTELSNGEVGKAVRAAGVRAGDVRVSAILSEIRANSELMREANIAVRKEGTNNKYYRLEKNFDVKAVEDAIERIDVPTIALGCITNDRLLRNIRSLQPGLPDDNHLFRVIDDANFPEDVSLSAFVNDNIVESLERVQNFVNSDNYQELMDTWSPENMTIKSFIQFLSAFDKKPFTIKGKPIRGLTFLKRIFSSK